nr:MAG TPA: hypothetical protein [Inoviridae sp.]
MLLRDFGCIFSNQSIPIDCRKGTTKGTCPQSSSSRCISVKAAVFEPCVYPCG